MEIKNEWTNEDIMGIAKNQHYFRNIFFYSWLNHNREIFKPHLTSGHSYETQIDILNPPTHVTITTCGDHDIQGSTLRVALLPGASGTLVRASEQNYHLPEVFV